MVGEEGRHAGPDHECRQASRRVGRDPPQVWQAGRVTALLGIATRLKLARLIQIVPAGSPRVRPLAAAGFSGGADIVMLDETRSPARAEASTLAAVGAVARETQGLTGHLGLPQRFAGSYADVVCLPPEADDVARVRSVVGPWVQVGRRCLSTEAIDAALADPEIGFLLVGPGRDLLLHASAVAPPSDPASRPWFAVGGVTHTSLDAVLRTGARRVAVGGAIVEASDPEAAAHAFKERLRQAWQDDPAMEAVTMAAFNPGAAAGRLDRAAGRASA